ncbi:MAG: hypothetical protein SFT93_02820 [Rickettsiaceae bacterium]|nr:hypothetical protein [Rickettsiaceae bacterium]
MFKNTKSDPAEKDKTQAHTVDRSDPPTSSVSSIRSRFERQPNSESKENTTNSKQKQSKLVQGTFGATLPALTVETDTSKETTSKESTTNIKSKSSGLLQSTLDSTLSMFGVGADTTKEKEAAENLLKVSKIKDTIERVNIEKIKSDSKGKDIILVLGNSKGGKSTLINFLIGSALSIFEDDNCKIRIEKTSPDGPEIGLNSTSETFEPRAWKASASSPLKRSGVDEIWDAPGFGDNRGVVQDVPNIFFIRTLAQNARSLKLVLVSDFNDLYHDNIELFINFLRSICVSFPHVIDMLNHNSINLVFTKAPENIDTKKIAKILNNKIKTKKISIDSDPAVDSAAKSFVDYFINSQKLMSIFGAPSDVTDEIASLPRNLLESIKESSYVSSYTIGQMGLGVSGQSRIFLLKYQEDLTSSPGFKKFLDYLKFGCEYQYPLDEKLTKKNIEKLEANSIRVFDAIMSAGQVIKSDIDNKSGSGSCLIAIKYMSSIDEGIESIAAEKSFISIIEFSSFLEEVCPDLQLTKIIKQEIYRSLNRICSDIQVRLLEAKKVLGRYTADEAEMMIRYVNEAREQNDAILNDSIEKLKQANSQIAETKLSAKDIGLGAAAAIGMTIFGWLVTPIAAATGATMSIIETREQVQGDPSHYNASNFATDVGLVAAGLVLVPLAFAGGVVMNIPMVPAMAAMAAGKLDNERQETLAKATRQKKYSEKMIEFAEYKNQVVAITEKLAQQKKENAEVLAAGREIEDNKVVIPKEDMDTLEKIKRECRKLDSKKIFDGSGEDVLDSIVQEITGKIMEAVELAGVPLKKFKIRSDSPVIKPKENLSHEDVDISSQAYKGNFESDVCVDECSDTLDTIWWKVSQGDLVHIRDYFSFLSYVIETLKTSITSDTSDDNQDARNYFAKACYLVNYLNGYDNSDLRVDFNEVYDLSFPDSLYPALISEVQDDAENYQA